MKSTFKTLLSWLLSLLVLAAASPNAFAQGKASGVCDCLFLNGGLAFLMNDGTVRVLQDDELRIEEYYGDYFVPVSVCKECENWTDMIQLTACNDVVAGLRADGTVLALGREDYVSVISKWDHMTKLFSLSGDYNAIAGLRDDGRVFTVGEDPFADWDSGVPESRFYNEIESLRDVKTFILGTCAAGGYFAALHNDGSVSPSSVYEDQYELKGWDRDEHFIALDSSGWGIIALREDGTCAVSGTDAPEYRDITDTWTDLKQVDCGDTFAIGLRNDGTFIFSRENTEDWPDAISEEFASLHDVDHFEMLGASNAIVVYYKDGRVDFFDYPGSSGAEALRSWTDIAKVLPIRSDTGLEFIGIKTDGSLVSTLEDLQLA